MKAVVSSLLVSMVMLCSCQVGKVNTTSVDELMVSLSQKRGRGIGPVYTIDIYQSGLAIYNGQKNTTLMGKHQKQLSKKQVKGIKQAFNKADFFSFDDEYTSMRTDSPSKYITYKANGKSKTIRDHSHSPNELKLLEKQIENIVEEGGWQKSN